MKCLYKRIIAGFCAVVTLFFSCVPFVQVARAANIFETITSVPVDFWDWCISSYYANTANPIASWFDKSVCPHCPDASGRHDFQEKRTTVDGKTGLFYICEYCGKSAGEVAEPVYDEYVAELPAPIYQSDGSLCFSLSHDYLSFRHNAGFATTYYTCEHDDVRGPLAGLDDKCSLVVDCVSNSFKVFPRSGQSIFRGLSADFHYSGVAPISGYYSRLPSPSISGYFDNDDGRHSLNKDYLAEDSVFFSAGDTILGVCYVPSFQDNNMSCKLAIVQGYAPVYKITPIAEISGDTYNIATRPTTITGGNYGIVGDDGTINTVTNNSQIVNETTNNYYNPATGQTSTILDWSYNYEDRTYDITLDTGDKVSVEYGDANIVIKEGDTVYNIYYMIDGSSPACDHTWQAGESTAPTCISPGKTLNTCTKCGATSVDITPALGHDWQVLRTVLTVYDEDGNQLQAGYTIYECTRCGEQYKDEGSTGPPASGPGANDGGLLEFLNGIIKYLSDNLSGVVALIRRFFSEIPGLFSGFTEFLAAVFPYLPEEIILLFTFGMAALVFVGVIKWMRR